jgi:hypothetical protein
MALRTWGSVSWASALHAESFSFSSLCQPPQATSTVLPQHKPRLHKQKPTGQADQHKSRSLKLKPIDHAESFSFSSLCQPPQATSTVLHQHQSHLQKSLLIMKKSSLLYSGNTRKGGCVRFHCTVITMKAFMQKGCEMWQRSYTHASLFHFIVAICSELF